MECGGGTRSRANSAGDTEEIRCNTQLIWSTPNIVYTINVSIMRRVEHLLINSALYSLYSTLVMPYLNYCCEIWGNTYKSRIYPLHIIQKLAIRICQKADYRYHSRPLFYQPKTLNVGLHDMVNLNSLVFMYNVGPI